MENIKVTVHIKSRGKAFGSYKHSMRPVDSGRIDISWSLPSKGNFTLKIEKRIDSGSYYTLAVLDSNITSYSDTEGILPNKYYYYRITAYDETATLLHLLCIPYTQVSRLQHQT